MVWAAALPVKLPFLIPLTVVLSWATIKRDPAGAFPPQDYAFDCNAEVQYLVSINTTAIHDKLIAVIRDSLCLYPGEATDALLEYFQYRHQQIGSALQDTLPIQMYVAITNKPYTDALSLGAIWALYLAAAHCFDAAQDKGEFSKTYSALVAIGAANKAVHNSQMPRQCLHEILEAFGSVMILGANAQLQESQKKHIDSEEDYFRRIAGKSAMLISVGAWSAGRLAELDSISLKSLKEFGMAWGMATQISDDCQDLEEDLMDGLHTLPVIKGKAMTGQPLHSQLMIYLNDPRENCDKINNLLEQMGIIADCQHLVATYQAQMSSAFLKYPDLKSIFHEIGLHSENLRLD